MTFYRFSNLAGRYNRDLSEYEIEECENDNFVFDGDDCITNALDFNLLKFKGDERKVENKNAEYHLQLHAHNGSGFDTWIIFKKSFLVINTLLIILKMEKV